MCIIKENTPKKFEEKYKELQPEKYKDTIAHVIQKGNENKVNPKLWMQDVLIRVQEKEREEKNDYTDLLPFNWKG